MTLCNLKISKTFKTHCCQQDWLNLKKVMAPSTKNKTKKPPLLPTTLINRFEIIVTPLEEREEKSIVVNNTRLVCLGKKKLYFKKKKTTMTTGWMLA